MHMGLLGPSLFGLSADRKTVKVLVEFTQLIILHVMK